jgi:HNH endonuclease
MKQEFDELTFQIDHIVSKKHHGSDNPDNLALACFACNNHKGSNLSGLDPVTGQLTRLFDPRKEEWSEHFEWEKGISFGSASEENIREGTKRLGAVFRKMLRR